MVVDKSFSYTKTTVKFYQDDLKDYKNVYLTIYQLWQSKWISVKSKIWPLTKI